MKPLTGKDDVSAEREIRIWQVGPHRDAQGGISTVISMLMAEQNGRPRIRVSHLATAVSGGKAAKAMIMVLAWLRLFFAGLLRRVDLLHVHSSAEMSLKRKALFMGLGRAFGIPCILHIHGSSFDTWYEESPPELQGWIRKQLDQAAGVVALSESWEKFLTPLTTTPVHVVYNSVPLDDFVWPRPQRAPGPLRMLFLGLLGKRKGSYDLLDAVHRVTSGPEAVAVELKIGGDGEINETEALIEKLNLSTHVEYLGWVGLDRKIELLSQTDVFVLPSYHEGLPMAILESMAAGAAVLTTPINGIPEAVHDGINGVFVEPGDVPALAEAIRSLATDIEQARQLGYAGRSEADQRFNICGAVDRLSEIYLSVART